MSCGLDVVAVLLDDNVSITETPPTIESEFGDMFFCFTTSKLDNSTSLGQNYIYYKIYNSSTIHDSEVNSITNIASDTNKKYNSATSMINTYHYQQLWYKENQEDESGTWFEISNAAHDIKIRLTSYLTEDYAAGIWIDNQKKGVPVRVVKSRPFDFGRDDEYLPLINEDDTKNFVETQGDDDRNKYYVALFSVFMMLDDDFVPVYNPVHYLGSVKIDSTSYDN